METSTCTKCSSPYVDWGQWNRSLPFYVSFVGSQFIYIPNSRCWFWPGKHYMNRTKIPAGPSSSQQLREPVEGLLRIRLVVIKERAFSTTISIVAPWLWNSLPRDAHEALMLTIFRRCLKTELYRQSFNIIPWFQFYSAATFKKTNKQNKSLHLLMIFTACYYCSLLLL